MDAFMQVIQTAGAVLLGLGVRLGVVLLALAVILSPVLIAVGAMRGFEWLRRRAHGVELAGGLCFRPGLLYAEGHTWVRKERGEARVGVDDLVRRILPWAVSVRLPRPGTQLKAGEPAATISVGQKEALIRAPLDGTVTAVNERLAAEPSLVKRDGYASGWLFAMRPADDAFLGLKGDREARSWLASEGDRLQRWVETRLGTAAADGGEVIDPIATQLDSTDWKALTESFLG